MSHTDSKNPLSSTSIARDTLRETIRDKANKEWVVEVTRSLKEELAETKKIALSARSRASAPHSCLHEGDLKSLSEAVNGWKNLKFGAIVTFLIAGAAAIAQYYALDNKTNETSRSMNEVQSSVAEIKEDVKGVTEAMDAHLKWAEIKDQESQYNEEQKLNAISDIVKTAIKESKTKQRR